MIREYRLFLCIDKDTKNPYLVDENGHAVESEMLLAADINGPGPFPVLLKVDDLRMDIDLEALYRKHLTSTARKTRIVFRDASGREALFMKQIANRDYPYVMIVTSEDGEENINAFSPSGECMSGNYTDNLMEYTIEKKSQDER